MSYRALGCSLPDSPRKNLVNSFMKSITLTVAIDKQVRDQDRPSQHLVTVFLFSVLCAHRYSNLHLEILPHVTEFLPR